MSDRSTPLTDAVLTDPGSAQPAKLAILCVRLERDRGELIEILDQAQDLRPILLVQIHYVPECVLNFCNAASALLARMKETP